MTLHTMLSELHYRDQIQEAVQKEINRLGDTVEVLADKAYQGEDFQFFLCDQVPAVRLTVITCLLVEKYEEYRARGISDSIIFDTFQDVTLRAEIYFQKTGRAGLEKDDVIWFRHIMNAEIFKIGSLQFQPFQMVYLDDDYFYMIYSTNAQELLPCGCPVLNCHVQRGADLHTEAVEDSFQRAKKFFAQIDPETKYTAFLCYSWLLYPPMIQALSPSSHIRQFAEKFQIIGTSRNSDQAMENLFNGKEKRLTPDSTFLQRMALKQEERFGFGCGVILL